MRSASPWQGNATRPNAKSVEARTAGERRSIPEAQVLRYFHLAGRVGIETSGGHPAPVAWRVLLLVECRQGGHGEGVRALAAQGLVERGQLRRRQLAQFPGDVIELSAQAVGVVARGARGCAIARH